MLPEFPSAARISEYVCDLKYLFSRMNLGSYGATEPSKKKCFSNALGYTLVVLEVLQAHRHFYLSIGPTKSGDNTF